VSGKGLKKGDKAREGGGGEKKEKKTSRRTNGRGAKKGKGVSNVILRTFSTLNVRKRETPAVLIHNTILAPSFRRKGHG